MQDRHFNCVARRMQVVGFRCHMGMCWECAYFVGRYCEDGLRFGLLPVSSRRMCWRVLTPPS